MSLFIHGFHCCPPEFFFDVIGTSSVVSPFFVAIHRSARAGIRQGIGRKYSVEYLFFFCRGKKRKASAVDFLPIVHVPLHCLLPSYLCNARKRNCRVPLSCQSERRALAVTPSPPFLCLRQPPSSPFSLYACCLRIPFNTHIRIIVYRYYNI